MQSNLAANSPLQRDLLRNVLQPNTSRRYEPATGKLKPLRRRRSLMAKVLLGAIVSAAVALPILLLALAAFAQPASAPAPAPVSQGVLAFLGALATQLAPVIGTGALALVGWVLHKGSAWLTAHTKSAYIQGVYARLDDAVFTAVQALEQTVVKDLGTLSAADRAKLKSDALAMVKSYMGASGLALLEKIVGVDELTGFLQGKIEAAVLQVNASGAAVTVPPAPAKA